jgi:hypothetical protein
MKCAPRFDKFLARIIQATTKGLVILPISVEPWRSEGIGANLAVC